MYPSFTMNWILRIGAIVVVLAGAIKVRPKEVFAEEGLRQPKTSQGNHPGEKCGSGQPNVPGGVWAASSGSSSSPEEQLATAVRALAKALKDPDPGVRESAVYGLRSMGLAAKEAIPSLGEAVRDQDGYVRAIAGRTLARFGQAAVPTLVPLLEDQRPEVRLVAAEALRTMGREAKEAVDALARALRDPSPAVRETAVHALREIGPDAQPALPALQLAAADRDGYVRSAAARAMVRIGPAALPALAELLHHPDQRVRRLAAEAMQTIGVETTDARLK
ncbi:MAG TPA: HEAT repeat domain-containing protein [Thermoguttaceae bacterium]|nr:HEAT repeat domain-containing protein [Thermoguttaceae bacterium]